MTEDEDHILRKKKKYNDQSDSNLESGKISSDDIKQILSNQNQLMGKLKSMQKELNEIKDQKKTIKLTVPPINTRSDQQKALSSISTSPRQFVIKHVFKDVVAKLDDEGSLLGDEKEHCGMQWHIRIHHNKENVDIGVVSYNYDIGNPWSITTTAQVKVFNSNGEPICKEVNYVHDKNDDSVIDFFKFEDLKNYLVDDTLTAEIHLKIEKMTGIYPKNLMNFDESNEECSDIILAVEDKKFYASKFTLATRSPYFKAMFLGRFQDSTMAEITLNGIDSDDFQKYLEVLYAEYAIDEFTVEGILHIADMYDTPFVIKRCEEFLIEKSEKEPTKMLEMSVRYNLEDLKKKVLDGIKTLDDIEEVVPADINDMDPSLLAILLKKALDSR